jgi:PAS domain S-box-containing protein
LRRVIQAIGQDITERKRSEAKHAQLIRSIEQVAESIVITDLEGTILYVNPAFEKVTGYSREEAIGNNPRILQSGHHPASFYQAMWETLLRGETWSGDLVNKRKDGSLFNEVATISPIRDQGGTVINYVAVKLDITREQSLRDQLSQSQKMDSLGRIAGGIAHDFNNLLMVIRTYVETLQNRLPVQDSLRENTEQVLEAVERGASLTGQLLAFSRKQIISPVVLDLNAVIDKTSKMLRRVVGEDIELHVVLSNALWAIKADPDQIAQVLMNLCVNARDAMPRGGKLKIVTENVTVKKRSVVERNGVLPGRYVMLSVTDSGEGISKKIQQDIFEPFFTTKDAGKGTGLGLAMVYGIVKQSGGQVWVDSKLGKGARFTIYLPKVAQTVAPTLPVQAKAPQRGTETLFVVEDEKSLRMGICDLLNSLGYTVLAASSGAEALAIACEQRNIDLLLTDVVMPKMGGRELAELLRNLQPKLKVIYMSGYTDVAVLRHGIHEQHTAFLQKPFGLSALASKVRDTLGQNDPQLTA